MLRVGGGGASWTNNMWHGCAVNGLMILRMVWDMIASEGDQSGEECDWGGMCKSWVEPWIAITRGRGYAYGEV